MEKLAKEAVFSTLCVQTSVRRGNSVANRETSSKLQGWYSRVPTCLHFTQIQALLDLSAEISAPISSLSTLGGCGNGLRACRWRSNQRCGAGLSLLATVLCSVLLRSLNICGVDIGKDGIGQRRHMRKVYSSIFKPPQKIEGIQ